MGATSNYKLCFGGVGKKAEEELGPRSQGVNTIGYLMKQLKGDGSPATGLLMARLGVFKILNFIS